MQWLALREAWWPMAVAVAWVLLRSRQVVEQLLDRHPRKPITFTTVATYAAALKAGGQHTAPNLENSEAAFHELRHHLETGEIEIVGTPFFRVGDRESLSARDGKPADDLLLRDQFTCPFQRSRRTLSHSTRLARGTRSYTNQSAWLSRRSGPKRCIGSRFP